MPTQYSDIIDQQRALPQWVTRLRFYWSDLQSWNIAIVVHIWKVLCIKLYIYIKQLQPLYEANAQSYKFTFSIVLKPSQHWHMFPFTIIKIHCSHFHGHHHGLHTKKIISYHYNLSCICIIKKISLWSSESRSTKQTSSMVQLDVQIHANQ